MSRVVGCLLGGVGAAAIGVVAFALWVIDPEADAIRRTQGP